MKAIVFDGNLRLSLDEPVPKPAKGEALIKVLMAGICNTDLEITKGYKNFEGILGHEFVGEVIEINSPNQQLLNKRVVGEINIGCHKADCEFCSKGFNRHCPTRSTIGIYQRNGCFAEFLTLPLENLHMVPASINNASATLIEPLAAAFEILSQIEITPQHEVLIVGDGKLGLLINHTLSTQSSKITHVGKHLEKLRLVNQHTTQTFLAEELPAQKFDIVIEATGSTSGFNVALTRTKARGTLVLKSTLASSENIDLTPVVVNEISVIGSRCGLFEPAINYLASGLDLSTLISHVFPFEKGLEAFKAASNNTSLKVILHL